jgi:hypothetical protein
MIMRKEPEMTRKRRVGHLAALPAGAIGVVVSVIMFMASPASAATGSGAGTGLFNYTGATTTGTLPCAEFTAMNFDTIATGSYASAFGGAYVGGVALHVQLAAGVKFYGNPSGDFYTDANCNNPTRLLIPVTGSVKSINPVVVGTRVACTYSGSYQRVGFNYTIALTGTCSVNGGTAMTTVEEHTGVITACTPSAQSKPPHKCDTTDTYVATGP